MTEYITLSNSGCLLPFLIIFNLFFGKLIFGSVGLWLGVEAFLILIFIVKIRLIFSRFIRQFNDQKQNLNFPGQKLPPGGKVIDIQGQEVQDEKAS